MKALIFWDIGTEIIQSVKPKYQKGFLLQPRLQQNFGLRGRTSTSFEYNLTLWPVARMHGENERLMYRVYVIVKIFGIICIDQVGKMKRISR